MEHAGELGLSKIADQGLAFAILVLMIVGLVWFIKYLLAELKDARMTSTQAVINCTAVMTRVEELQRQAINR